MASAVGKKGFLNPCLLHMQKMGLELKCPMCLDLLSRPQLLPCNHVMCSSCLSRPVEFKLKCTICKLPYTSQDVRSTPFIENMTNIYKSMESAFDAYLFHLKSLNNLHDGRLYFGKNVGSENTSNTEKLRGGPQSSPKEDAVCLNSSEPSFLCRNKADVPNFPSQQDEELPERPPNFCELRNDLEIDRSGRLGFQSSVCYDTKDASTSDKDPTVSLNFWLENLQGKDCSTRHRNVSHQEQTSLGSPPPFCDSKDSDDDSRNHGIIHGTEELAKRILSSTKTHPGMNLEASAVMPSSPYTDISTSDTTNLENSKANVNKRSLSPAKEHSDHESKRQKLNLECQVLSSNKLNPVDANLVVECAFCQSPKASEVTGAMLHYANGEAVVAEPAQDVNVVHVHKRCVEWAPQVYFVNETIMNLEAEVARGAKIKCSECGKKGAALGCYAKSCRRSYHVPCSVYIEGCRWDDANFLMLCPTHSSLKFPSEKSKSKKHMKAKQCSFLKGSLKSNSTREESTEVWTASLAVTCGWVLCGSALSPVEKDLVNEFASLTGSTIKKNWDPSVTHVISSTDATGACRRTLKILMGILNGKWILTFDWVKACLEAQYPVPEEAYEVSQDIHGCCDGPKNGRERVMEKAPKLFSGVYFYFSEAFEPSYKGDLKDLIIVAGGVVLDDKKEIRNTEAILATTIVIYNADPSDNCNESEFSEVIESNRKEAELLASGTGAWVAAHTWLLDSIAACKLLPLVS
ncbi:BRCA1-associated RING domain protein 1 [Aristolochia californica]|uniref:BRCA1-associated RING domain protein 1 n=1 Tax=Aristolochia californica TaxID=171875 RepID=UPI0035DDDCA1